MAYEKKPGSSTYTGKPSSSTYTARPAGTYTAKPGDSYTQWPAAPAAGSTTHPRYEDFDFSDAVTETGLAAFGTTDMAGGAFEIANAPENVDPTIIDVDTAAALQTQCEAGGVTVRLGAGWVNGTNITLQTGSADCEIIIPSGRAIGHVFFESGANTATRIRFRGPGKIGGVWLSTVSASDILFDGIEFEGVSGWANVVANATGSILTRWEFLHCTFVGNTGTTGAAVFVGSDFRHWFIANCSLSGGVNSTADDFVLRQAEESQYVIVVDSHLRSSHRDPVRQGQNIHHMLMASTPNGIAEGRRMTVVNVNNAANWRDTGDGTNPVNTNHIYGYDITFIVDDSTHGLLGGHGGNVQAADVSALWDLKRSRWIVYDSGVVDATRLGQLEDLAGAGETWNYGGNGATGDGSATFVYTSPSEPENHAEVTPADRTSPLTGATLGDPRAP